MLSPISISTLSAETMGDTHTFTKIIGDTFAASYNDTFCCRNLHSHLRYLAFFGDQNYI